MAVMERNDKWICPLCNGDGWVRNREGTNICSLCSSAEKDFGAVAPSSGSIKKKKKRSWGRIVSRYGGPF